MNACKITTVKSFLTLLLKFDGATPFGQEHYADRHFAENSIQHVFEPIFWPNVYRDKLVTPM
jgi:hypothetical protein